MNVSLENWSNNQWIAFLPKLICDILNLYNEQFTHMWISFHLEGWSTMIKWIIRFLSTSSKMSALWEYFTAGVYSPIYFIWQHSLVKRNNLLPLENNQVCICLCVRVSVKERRKNHNHSTWYTRKNAYRLHRML